MNKMQLKGIVGGVALALGLLAADGLANPVQAQSFTRDIDVVAVPRNPDATVDLSLIVQKLEYATDEEAVFKFKASESGYVSLWDFGTSGNVTRIFPNRYSGPESARVQAGKTYTAGIGDTYRLKVTGPAGTESVYAIWTRTADAQPASVSELQPMTGALTRDLLVVERIPPKDWVSEKVTFRINEAGRSGPVVNAVSSQRFSLAGSGRLYALVMGSNVGELSYTNADAQAFGQTLRNMFPRGDVTIIENATVAQFRDKMAWLRREVQPGDTVVVFFSGHGSTIEDQGTDERDGLDEIFIMFDVQTNRHFDEDFVVRDDTYREWVAALDTENVITVIDACHSGGLFKSFNPRFRTKSFVGYGYGKTPKSVGMITEGDEAWDSPKGLLYAAAAEEEQALEDPARGGGAFTLEFLNQVEDARSGDSLDDIFQRTRDRVLAETAQMQTPSLAGDREIGKKITRSR